MAINFYLLLAFGAMLFWALADFLIQKTTRQIGNIETLAFIGIFGSFALFPFVVRDLPSLLSIDTLVLLILLGILTFIAAIFDFEALKICKLSTADMVMEIELPIAIILSYVILGEKLSLIHTIIIGIILVGTILVATDSWKDWKITLEKGIILAFIAGFGMGLLDFFTSVASRHITPAMAIWFPWIIFSVICLSIIWKRKGLKKFLLHSSDLKWLIIIMACLDTLAWLFYAIATENEKIGITLAITEAYPAVALLLGMYFNKEKINWIQGVGAALALGGSVTLAFFV